MAWSRSASAVTMVASLPPVSAISCMSGRALSICRAVSVPPVRMTASTPGFSASFAPTPLPEEGMN